MTPRILAAITLGVITTTAIAWTLATRVPLANLNETHQYRASTPQTLSIHVWTFARTGMRRRAILHDEYRPPVDSRPLNPSEQDFSRHALDFSMSASRTPGSWIVTTPVSPNDGAILFSDPGVTWDDARGWPALALWSWFNLSSTANPAKPFDVHGGISLDPSWPTMRVLPLLPLWPGFLVDTLVYAAPFFALFTAAHTYRRHRRRARGHCPACNYNLRDLPTPTCPECGAASPSEPPAAAGGVPPP